MHSDQLQNIKNEARNCLLERTRMDCFSRPLSLCGNITFIPPSTSFPRCRSSPGSASPFFFLRGFNSSNLRITNASSNLNAKSILRMKSSFFTWLPDHGGCDGNDNNNNNNNNNGPFNFDSWWEWNDDSPSSHSCSLLLFLLSLSSSFFFFGLSSALARAYKDDQDVLWEVRGSKRTKLVPDVAEDAFVTANGIERILNSFSLSTLLFEGRALIMRFLLPEGYPDSVTNDYMDYSLWRGVQGVASQISGVLATQALLYAVGLGKGAIPTAAAINWVLKDGIGYLSKITLSKYGRHFDVNPKGWRLFADLLENAAFGMEMLTPAFPHLFVLIGAVAGAGRSASALIQAATRSCFFAGFAAKRNFAEVIAKGEAQGMVSKSIGIMLGIALANRIGSSTSLALATFTVVTWIHMYCNLKSYQSIQLRTLNPYRASLVFSEYLLSGQAPSIREVNYEEPFFPAVPVLNIKSEDRREKQLAVLSPEAKKAAAEIEQRLEMGSKLSDVVRSREDALALLNLYRNEEYILTEHKGRFCVILKESCSPQDMLKSLFQVNYLYWLEQNAGVESSGASTDCRAGGRLQISLDYVLREFNHSKTDSESVGWVTDGLIARPLPSRIRVGCRDVNE